MALRDDVAHDRADRRWSVNDREIDYLEFQGPESWILIYPAASVAHYELDILGIHDSPEVERFPSIARYLPAVLEDVRVHDMALRLLLRARSMGLTTAVRGDVVLAAPLMGALSALSYANIGRDVTSRLVSARADPSVWRSGLMELMERMERSPAPDREWSVLREVFSDSDLAPLVGANASDVEGYASGRERTPDPIANRLHFLSLLVADLATAYNDYGIRRWFQRKRTQLDGRAPKDIFAGAWDPDDADPLLARRLAEQLLGAPAT